MTNYIDNKEEIATARYALATALKNGASAVRISLNMGIQNAFAVLDGKLDRLHMANDRSLYIQLYAKGRYGAFSTNRIEKGELEHFIKEAIAATTLLAEDNCRSLPDPSLYYKGKEFDLGQFDETFFNLSQQRKKEIAFEIYSELENKSKKLISANSEYGDYLDYQYIIDSQDFEGESIQSGFTISAECSVKGRGDSRPEAWWYDNALKFNDVKIKGCGETALDRALKKLGSKKIKGGKYKMIVENVCSSRLVSPIITALGGENIQQKNSFLIDKLGERIFPEHMNLIDTPLAYGMSGSRYFDGEGIATKNLKIIDNGVINTYFINTYYANKIGTTPTIEGPSVPKFSTEKYAPEYRNMTLQDMIRSIGTGILVTGFNGGNCNGTTGDFSYGVEGFFIDNGVIAHPIREMNITGNIITLWNNLLFTGNDARSVTRWQIPSLAFENVDFTGM